MIKTGKLINEYGLEYIYYIISCYREHFQPLIKVALQKRYSDLIIGEACRLSRIYRAEPKIQSKLPHLYLGDSIMYQKRQQVPLEEKKIVIQNYQCNTPSWVQITGKVSNANEKQIENTYEFIQRIKCPKYVSLYYDIDSGKQKMIKHKALHSRTIKTVNLYH